ncbi:ABC transporter permease subunit [Paenibacillus flagellatus]|uniref:ABC transporter permease n=1 Tax=Paenibacillus flagellatus TaxID=2211139 RepID=A0A2V5JXN4_9BACL|nr:ABC transporter permease subunit [Paenibacillus flagellatus]PYI51629.1 ABC transporter permease [Paenibacillus flagellatus]
MTGVWGVLYTKEMKELWRSRKWIWVPLVFVLLGVSQPIVAVYLPELLKAAGSLPAGAVIDIPKPAGGEVLAQTLSQYGTVGVLVLVLALMGTVSAERASGAAGLVLAKPVPFASYITAKWAAAVTLGSVSFTAGYVSSWYYAELLIGPVAPERALPSMLLYALWLAFVATATVALSAALNGGGAAAFAAIGGAMLLTLTAGLFERYTRWSPGTLAGRAASVLARGEAGPQLALAAAATVALGALLLALAVRLLRRRELLP